MSLRNIFSSPPSLVEDPKPRSLRWLRILILLILFAANLGVWAYYLTSHKPLLAALPPVQQATRAVAPHYLFSIHGLQEPVGVAATSDGNRIYVAESGGERLIHAFDRDGKELFNFAPPNSQPLTRAPIYVALDSAGKVYVTDRLRHTVDIFDAGGNFLSTLKPPTTDGWSPLGVRISDGNLLFTDVTDGKHRVLELASDGSVALKFGRQGNSNKNDELWFPNSMVTDARGRAYISDSNNARIQILDANGKWSFTLRGFSLPRGLAIDESQRLYVVDGIGQLVRVFDVAGDQPVALFDFGDYGPGDGEFNYPNDVAVDSTDRLFVADRASNRVQVWSY